MKTATRYLAMFFALCMLAGAFCACNGGSESSDDTQTDTQAPANAYVFTVICEDTQAPAAGVKVQLCDGDLCIMPVASDAEGKVNYDLGSSGLGVYEIHIMENSLPEGYTFDNEAFQTTADVRTYTLVLKKKCDNHSFINDVCTKCGAKKTYTHTVNVFYAETVSDAAKQNAPVAGVSIIINDGTKLIAQGTTDADGKFCFDAPKYVSANEITGYVVAAGNLPSGYRVADNSFVVDQYVCNVELFEEIVPDPYTAFNPQKVKIGATVHFTLDGARVDDAGSLFSTVYDDSLYYFSVKPTKKTDVGYYSIKITNAPAGVKFFLAHCPSTSVSVSMPSNNCVTSENPILHFIMEEKYLKDSTGEWTFPNTWIFGIRVEGDANYPVEFDVTVTRERDLIEGVDYEIREEVKPTANTNVKADKPSGTMTQISAKDAADMVAVGGSDGYYHCGTADGPILYLNLKNPNPIFKSSDDDASGVSFLTVNSMSGTENLLYSEMWTADGKSYVRVTYYFTMLSQYGELCNDDGLYPVNAQLYDFLIKWVGQRASSQVTNGLSAEHALLIACRYYAAT